MAFFTPFQVFCLIAIAIIWYIRYHKLVQCEAAWKSMACAVQCPPHDAPCMKMCEGEGLGVQTRYIKLINGGFYAIVYCPDEDAVASELAEFRRLPFL